MWCHLPHAGQVERDRRLQSSATEETLGTEGQAAVSSHVDQQDLSQTLIKSIFTVTGTLVTLKLGQGGVLSVQRPALKGSNYPPQTPLKQPLMAPLPAPRPL